MWAILNGEGRRPARPRSSAVYHGGLLPAAGASAGRARGVLAFGGKPIILGPGILGIICSAI